jgi:hypothetical protein
LEKLKNVAFQPWAKHGNYSDCVRVRVDPLLRNLRNDTRCEALLRKMNLPQ